MILLKNQRIGEDFRSKSKFFFDYPKRVISDNRQKKKFIRVYDRFNRPNYIVFDESESTLVIPRLRYCSAAVSVFVPVWPSEVIF
jgi:hypothetical protein